MVTCDIDAGPAPATARPTPDAESGDDTATLWYRQPRSVRLSTWKVTATSNNRLTFVAELRSVERVLVVDPSATRTIVLPLNASSDTTMSIEFSEAGGLKKLASERAGRLGERATMIAGLPAALGASAAAGAGLAGAFDPAAARVAGLKAQLDEVETRNALHGLLNPLPTSHAALRAELVEAELQARLAVARQTAQDPTSMTARVSEP